LERYFAEPYRFIPPYRGTFWCRVARMFVLRHLRLKHGVHKFHVEGASYFQESLARGAGILLTPNHSRWADPLVLGAVAGMLGRYLYYMASYHLFKQGKVRGWLLRRLGGFSVWREGPDRESIKTAVQILADAERPLVLFPEGTWLRQNDRVLPLQEGLSLILRQAIKQGSRPLVTHPMAIKYWMLEDPTEAVASRLSALEKSLGWAPQTSLPPVARVEKLGGALLGLREVELLGQAQPGGLDQRITRLIHSQLERLEQQHLGRAHDGWALERVRRLRQQMTRKLLEGGPEADLRRDLGVLLLCENLTGHSLAYLQEHPTPERLVETVQRIEETVTDRPEKPVVPMGVSVRFGPAIDARELLSSARGERGSDPLVQRLRPAIQGLLDEANVQGPPEGWRGPIRTDAPEPARATPREALHH
jgi:1-acyl-sn-glycerol-3-phosphate acyltransferase